MNKIKLIAHLQEYVGHLEKCRKLFQDDLKPHKLQETEIFQRLKHNENVQTEIELIHAAHLEYSKLMPQYAKCLPKYVSMPRDAGLLEEYGKITGKIQAIKKNIEDTDKSIEVICNYIDALEKHD